MGMLQAVICGIYHYCDQHRTGTDLNGPVCSEQGYRPSLGGPIGIWVGLLDPMGIRWFRWYWQHTAVSY